MSIRIVIALLGSLVMLPAGADNTEFVRDGELYLGWGGYIHDTDRALEYGSGVEFGFERPMTEDLSWDLWYSTYKADGKDGSVDGSIKRLSPGLLYHLNEGNTRAFLSMGLGHQRLKYRSLPKERETEAHFGLGVKAYQDTKFILRAELLSLYSFDHELTDHGVRLTLGYSFGRKYIREAPEPEPEPIPEPEPEPIPEPEPEPIPEPEPEPSDEDLDGVYDDKDLCPGTNPAFRVDENGCAIILTEEVSIELDIKFAADSHELTIEFYPELKKVVDLMKQASTTTLTVEGHTDSQGSRRYNQKLSQRRAESVRLAMVDDFGIAGDRIVAVGYGEEQPIADNSSDEGRAKNRRVVAVLKAMVSKEALR